MDKTVIDPPNKCPKCGSEKVTDGWCEACSTERTRVWLLGSLLASPFLRCGACVTGLGLSTGFNGKPVNSIASAVGGSLFLVGIVALVAIPILAVVCVVNEIRIAIRNRK